MRLLVLGGDGYLGWPTAMHLAARGHEVLAVDNYLRRTLALQTHSEALFPNPDLQTRAELFESLTGFSIRVAIGDCTNASFLAEVFRRFGPDALVHYAEQPSAPYSMRGRDEAELTLRNNLLTTLNVAWVVSNQKPDCQIIKLGTMGEYGTPNIDIEEGWINIDHKGRSDRFLFPRAAGSLYHTSKIMDTDLLWFYVRVASLSVTDLMQGPVYGLTTDETSLDDRLLPNFHYDDIFGTVLNRFLSQAVSHSPMTIYGAGGQRRGYLNLIDSLRCVELSILNPAKPGELRIFNQFTEVFTVNDLACKVQSAGRALGLHVEASHINNPRQEQEEHYYEPAHTRLLDLGLEPTPLTEESLVEMLRQVRRFKDYIDESKLQPRVRWLGR